MPTWYRTREEDGRREQRPRGCGRGRTASRALCAAKGRAAKEPGRNQTRRLEDLGSPPGTVLLRGVRRTGEEWGRNEPPAELWMREARLCQLERGPKEMTDGIPGGKDGKLATLFPVEPGSHGSVAEASEKASPTLEAA